MISFEPMKDATVNIAVSSSSQSIQIYGFSGDNQVRAMNNASATVFISFGDSSVVVTAASGIPMPAGGVEVFSVGGIIAGGAYGAVIAPSGTGNVYFTPGSGI